MKDPVLATIELAAMELLETAMEQPEAAREKFIRVFPDISDEIRERVLQLLASDRESQADIRTGGAADHEHDEILPNRIGAYRILRLLGRGGMGAVFLGERASDDFEHVVAIKLIKQRLLSESLIGRFRRERQILAQLNHPHIAHFYDGGETEDGSPYIVMEFVDGIPVTSWIEQHNPDFDRRLRLFEQICDAVEFAHQNLIIHRDLTPNNVLVTAGDQAKLIDFGIARPQAEDGTLADASTLSGLSLTPGFAAPERSKGAAANTLSDIYSLGRILHFLTKEYGDPDVAAIAAKATSEDPNDRYPTANAITRDVERYLSGEAVEARNGGRRYMMRKFFHRHRNPVLATMAALLVIVGALVTTLWAYNQAETARAQSERRFDQTRELASVLMFDVFDEVSKVPGAVKARVLLAETAQKYLDSLAAEDTGSVDLWLDVAEGYMRLRQSVGGFQGSTIGKVRDGKSYMAQSRSILEKLYNDHPENDAVRAAFGKLLSMSAGDSIYVDGDPKVARKLAGRAVSILTDVKQPDKDSANALGTAYYYLGESDAFEGKWSDSERIFLSGNKAMQAMPSALKKEPEVRRAHATLLNQLAIAYASQDNFSMAESAINKAIIMQEETAKITGGAPRELHNLSLMYLVHGRIQLKNGNHAASLSSAEKSVKIAREGMRKSPDDAGPKETFVTAAMIEGAALAKLGRKSEAVALVDEAVALGREQLKRTSDVVAGPMGFAVRIQEASEVYFDAGEKQRGCILVREALGIFRNYMKTEELPKPNVDDNLKPMLAALKEC